MIDFNPFEEAKREAEARNSGGGGNIVRFKLDDGETKTLRFLNGLVDYDVISHSCGANLIELRSADVEAARAAGQPVLCPACGQPLSEGDFQYKRPSMLAADVYSFIETVNGRRTFLSLDSSLNAKGGLVPNNNGEPMYHHPDVAKQKGDKGFRRPGLRGYAVAVEREVAYEEVMVNGIPTRKAVGVVDKMVQGDDGKEHPSIVMVDMPFRNFWMKVGAALGDNGYSTSICYYDWTISRTGSRLDTNYDIRAINLEAPTVVDMRQYEEWMPDIRHFLEAIGNPEYFAKNGIPVAGYVPQTQDGAVAQAQAQPQPVAQGYPAQQMPPQPPMGVPQGMAPQGIPQEVQQAATVPWDSVMGR